MKDQFNWSHTKTFIFGMSPLYALSFGDRSTATTTLWMLAWKEIPSFEAHARLLMLRHTLRAAAIVYGAASEMIFSSLFSRLHSWRKMRTFCPGIEALRSRHERHHTPLMLHEWLNSRSRRTLMRSSNASFWYACKLLLTASWRAIRCSFERTGPDEGSMPPALLKSKLGDSAEGVAPCCPSSPSSSSSPSAGVSSRIKASNSSSAVRFPGEEEQLGEEGVDMRNNKKKKTVKRMKKEMIQRTILNQDPNIMGPAPVNRHHHWNKPSYIISETWMENEATRPQSVSGVCKIIRDGSSEENCTIPVMETRSEDDKVRCWICLAFNKREYRTRAEHIHSLWLMCFKFMPFGTSTLGCPFSLVECLKSRCSLFLQR